jgi:excisionase family DNA binding protein
MNLQTIPQQISYTPAQVAQMLGVKTSTVHAWLSRSEMRGNKVGHHRFITPQQITEFYSRRKGCKTGDYVDYTYANGPVRQIH